MAAVCEGADIRAAILDLDGTLVDTLGDFTQALQRMLVDLPEPYASYKVLPEVVEPLIGKGSENLISRLLAHIDGVHFASHFNRSTALASPAAVFDNACTRYQHHYAAVNGQWSAVYPGVKEGLRAFDALGWPLACVTNKPTALAESLLRAKGLDRFFRLTLGGDAVARKKPDPLPLVMACERLGISPAHTVMVGDSTNDAQAARAAGCPVWLMRYGYNHGQPIEAVDADGWVDSLAELPWLNARPVP